MPQTVSQFIGVTPEEFAKTGALDAVLDVDSKLFIDPHLLQSTKAKELKGAYTKVRQRFIDILYVLSKSKHHGDRFWREAISLFTFPELEGLCIGYSSSGTGGSGMGTALRARIIETAKEIIDIGITDPEIFELVGLFEDNIGADRISDMVGRIIVEDLRRYTERIFLEMKAVTEQRNIAGKTHNVVVNPFNNLSIILLPKDILRDLPIAYCWADIDRVCATNHALRRQVNSVIGNTWKRATSRRIKKGELKEVLLSKPEVLRDLIAQYKAKAPTTYNFDNDPAGEVIWLPASHEYVKNSPTNLTLPDRPTSDDVLKVAIDICAEFKQGIENNALYDLLYNDDKRPKKEAASQKLFYGIAHCYCKANNLDLSPESNAGRGPVDFKLSRGFKGKVVVETKLSVNQNLLHGFETQVVEYQKAEQAEYAILLVIDVGGSSIRITNLRKAIETKKKAGLRVPEVIFVDAKPKISATKSQHQHSATRSRKNSN